MPAYVHHIATLVPGNGFAQEDVGEAMLAQLEPGGRGARLLSRIYRHSSIEKRHSVIGDYRLGEGEGVFFDRNDGRFLSPTTRARNDIYSIEARRLYSEVARRAITDCPGVEIEDVTHVVTVSCTGFFAPGPDFYIVKDLGLDPATRRFHVGFMGCYAAFPALRMAQAFCAEDESAVVLVVCLELCTLHLEPSEEIDDIIAASVFADGAAAAVVTARPPGEPSAATLRIESLVSTVAPGSEDDMAWTLGDHGFDMVLSTSVPQILQDNARSVVDALLRRMSLTLEQVDHWAIHPGGRAILDKVQAGLELADDALDESRHVLRNFGNMSSATILFVLERFLAPGRVAPGERVYAMAFGPGLTVESGLFVRS